MNTPRRHSRSLLQLLAHEFTLLLDPIGQAAASPEGMERLLAQLGVFTADAGPAAAFGALLDLQAQIETLAAQDDLDFGAAEAALQASRRAFTLADAISDVGGSSGAMAGIGRDVVDLLIETSGLLCATQWLAGILALLTLLETEPDRPERPPVVNGDIALRGPIRLDRLRLDRLPALLRDPVAVLKARYVNPLATDADAAAMADRLFPQLVQVLRALGVSCRYGFKTGDDPQLGDAAPLMKHALIIYAVDSLLNGEPEAGVVLALSPASKGDLGLVVSPFGAVGFTKQSDRWVFESILAGQLDVLAWGRHGLTLLAQAPDAQIAADLVAHTVPRGEGPAYVFGAQDGTRIELSSVRLAAGLAASVANQSLTLSADLAGAAIVITPGTSDGFLASVLPTQGLRANADLGLVWSSHSGLTLRGSGGLTAALPMRVSVGGVTLSSVSVSLQVRDASLLAEVAVSMSVALGPVQAAVDGIGLGATLSFPQKGGSVGVADLDIGFKPPTGIGLSVEAGPVVGGGFLNFDPDRGEYAGEVQLQFEQIALRATGLLTTRLPDGRDGFSLLVIVSAEFPPVQLGLGFMLVAVGGLLGINRTVSVEALRAGLKTGALGAVLSPPKPEANAAQLVASLAGLFPPASGRHVFAPTARIVWGTPTLITIDLCLVLELPAPVRLVALGRLHAVLPDERDAIVRIQVDMLGVIDFDRGEAAVDATLVDSRLAQFTLTGDMALRMSWGSQASFLLAVGGFHPRFAAPPGFPALERVAIALAGGDNPKLRLEAYFALTSNTVQFGARVDLLARAGSFSISGFLSFDALVTLDPLAFVADISAKLAVKAGGSTLFSLSLALTLSGPRPWRARGRASFSILFFEVSFGFDVTIGDDAKPALPPPIDVAALLRAALGDVRAWSARLPAGAGQVVTVRALEPAGKVLAHPLATLEVRQRVAPLDRTLDRFGTSAPSGARRFRIASATVGAVATTLTPLRDRFAPAQFTTMSDDAKLSAPSFEEMTSGAALGADGYVTGAGVTVAVVYEQRVVTAAGVPEPASERVAIPGDVFLTLTATPPARSPVFTVREAV